MEQYGPFGPNCFHFNPPKVVTAGSSPGHQIVRKKFAKKVTKNLRAAGRLGTFNLITSFQF